MSSSNGKRLHVRACCLSARDRLHPFVFRGRRFPVQSVHSTLLFASCALAAVMVIGVRSASAQQAVSAAPPVVAVDAQGQASPTLSRFHSDTLFQDDVLVGGGKPATFVLSWKNAHQNSEIVVRGGITRHAGVDYDIDLTAGTIRFLPDLASGELAYVSYRCDTSNVSRNNASLLLPLQWNLWSLGQNRLSLSSLVRSDTAVGASPISGGPRPFTQLQFDGGSRFAPGSTLGMGLYLDLQGGNLLRRGGILMSEESRLGPAVLGFAYTRAGTLFSQPNGSSLVAGQESMGINGDLTPVRVVTFHLAARQTTLLIAPDRPGIDGDQSGAVTRELSGGVTASLPGGGKVEAGRVQTAAVTAHSGAQTVTIHDTAAVTQPLAPGTDASLAYDATAMQLEGAPPQSAAVVAPSYSQAAGVMLKSAPSKQVTLTGAFHSRIAASGSGDDTQLAMEVRPLQAVQDLKINTLMEDRYRIDGTQRRREAMLQLPSLTRLRVQLSGGVRQQSTTTSVQTTGILDAVANPLKPMQLNGAFRWHDSKTASIASYDVRMTLKPWNRVRFLAGTVRNPEDDDGSVRSLVRRNLGWEADLGLVGFRGKYAIEEDIRKALVTDSAELGLDLHLTPWDTLNTGYQARNLFMGLLTGDITYSLGFTHRLGSAFDLSLTGLLTQHNASVHTDVNQNEYQAQAKLGLHF